MGIRMKPFEGGPRQETDIERARRERTERPYPLPDEDLNDWLRRIGGPFVKVDQLQQCPKCGSIFSVEKASLHQCTERESLSEMIVDRFGNLHIPERGLKNPEKIREMIEKGDPNLSVDDKDNFHFKKEAFEEEEKPIKTYLDFIKSKVGDEIPVVIDENASESFEDWIEELEKKREKETSEKESEEVEEE